MRRKRQYGVDQESFRTTEMVVFDCYKNGGGDDDWHRIGGKRSHSINVVGGENKGGSQVTLENFYTV